MGAIMKQLRGWIYLGSFSAGTVFVEYEILQRLGGAFVLLATLSVFAAVAGALYRAPQGAERADALHIRRRHRPSILLPAVRPSQRQIRRGWA
jgi:hypothetical protein